MGDPPPPSGWGGLDTPDIITTTAAAATSAAAEHADSFPSLVATTGRISLLKCIYLCFVCGVATDAYVTSIWGEVAAAPTNHEGISVLSHYLLTGMELCRCNVHRGGESVKLSCRGPVF